MNEDIKNGKLGKDDGGLAKYITDCNKGIDWENTRVVGIENRLRQRKVYRGWDWVTSKYTNKNKVLNSFKSLMTWRPLLDRYFYKDNVNTCARAV